MKMKRNSIFIPVIIGIMLSHVFFLVSGSNIPNQTLFYSSRTSPKPLTIDSCPPNTEVSNSVIKKQNEVDAPKRSTLSPQAIDLPQPDLEGKLSIWDCYLRQELAMDFQETSSPSLKDLSQLLWAAQGITRPPRKRTCPSAGATYPLDVFLFVSNDYLPDLSNGVYQYKPKTHSLSRVLDSVQWDGIREIVDLSGEKQFIGNVSTLLVVTAEYERTTQRYGNRGIRYVYLEVGHVIQNIILQSVSRNVITRPIVQFNSSSMKNILNTDELEPLVLMPLGSIRSESKGSNSFRSPANVNEGTIADMHIEQAIYRRQSIRDYDKGNLESWQVDRLLWGALGFRNPWTGERTFASISGKFPLELYLIAIEVESIDPALYYYNSSVHTLTLLKAGDQRELLLERGGNKQAMMYTAQIFFVISIRENLLTADFDVLDERIALFEAGMCGQNIYLLSAALNLGTVAVGAFSDKRMKEDVVGMSDDETPVYIYPVGKISSILYVFFPYVTQYYALISQYLALGAFIAFSGSIVAGFPPLRRRHRLMRLAHHVLAFAFATLAIIHLLIIHGISRVLIDPFDMHGYSVLIQSLFNFSLPSNLDETGLLLARIAIPLSIVLFLFFIPWKPIQSRLRTKGRRRKIHSTLVVLTFFTISLHAASNGTYIRSILTVFTFFLIIAPAIYLILRYYMLTYRRRSRKVVTELPTNGNR